MGDGNHYAEQFKILMACDDYPISGVVGHEPDFARVLAPALTKLRAANFDGYDVAGVGRSVRVNHHHVASVQSWRHAFPLEKEGEAPVAEDVRQDLDLTRQFGVGFGSCSQECPFLSHHAFGFDGTSGRFCALANPATRRGKAEPDAQHVVCRRALHPSPSPALVGYAPEFLNVAFQLCGKFVVDSKIF